MFQIAYQSIPHCAGHDCGRPSARSPRSPFKFVPVPPTVSASIQIELETDESLPPRRTSGGISCPRRSRLEARPSASPPSACGKIARLLFRELRDKGTKGQISLYADNILRGFRDDVTAGGARHFISVLTPNRPGDLYPRSCVRAELKSRPARSAGRRTRTSATTRAGEIGLYQTSHLPLRVASSGDGIRFSGAQVRVANRQGLTKQYIPAQLAKLADPRPKMIEVARPAEAVEGAVSDLWLHLDGAHLLVEIFYYTNNACIHVFRPIANLPHSQDFTS